MVAAFGRFSAWVVFDLLLLLRKLLEPMTAPVFVGHFLTPGLRLRLQLARLGSQSKNEGPGSGFL